MGILTLGAGQGMTITVSATGAQALEALDAIELLIANRFGEDE
jgi:phosphocarrier protein